MRLCFGHPAVASINWRGFSDRNIWVLEGGLVDEEYQPKLVYNMLDSMINKEWKIHLSIYLGSKGEASFRGFYGKYEITLSTQNGRIRSYSINVRKYEENKWEFTIY